MNYYNPLKDRNKILGSYGKDNLHTVAAILLGGVLNINI